MIAKFRQSFEQDLQVVTDKSIRNQIRALIGAVEKSEQIADVSGLEQVSDSDYYKMGVGDYRLGFLMEDSTLTFIRCLHRDEIRKYFLMKIK